MRKWIKNVSGTNPVFHNIIATEKLWKANAKNAAKNQNINFVILKTLKKKTKMKK